MIALEKDAALTTAAYMTKSSPECHSFELAAYHFTQRLWFDSILVRASTLLICEALIVALVGDFVKVVARDSQTYLVTINFSNFA